MENNSKLELANELSVHISACRYWGDKSKRECPYMGGYMLKSMIDSAEQDFWGCKTNKY